MSALCLKYFPALLALLLFGSNIAISQPATVRFRHISVEQGFSSSQVTSIAQDKNGFLWFGTWKGLNRYDGYEFKVFRHDPKSPASLSDGGIFALLSDQSGGLWVGTSTGLDRFDETTETFTHYVFENKDPATKAQNNNVFYLCEDRQGNVWAGCRYGLHRVEPKTGKTTSYANNPNDPVSLSDSRVRALHIAADGTLWVGTAKGLNRFDPGSGKFHRFFPDSLFFNIKDGKDGALFLATRSGEYFFNPATSNILVKCKPEEYPPVFVDKNDGASWFFSKNGLTKRWADGRSEEFTYSPNNHDGLNSANINLVFQDREGSIWICTDNGLNLLTPDAFRFRHFKHRPNDLNSLSHDVVLCVFEGRDGAIWLGTMGGGLNRLDPKTGSVRRYPFDVPDSPRSTSSGNIFRVVEDFTGTLWVGLLDKGLDRLDPKTGTFSHHRWNDIRDMVSYFYESKDSVLWIGHQGGVSRFDRESGDFGFAHYAPEAKKQGGLGVVTGILEDHTGAWWVCSNGYYLNRFDPRTMKYERYLPNPSDSCSIRSDNIQAIYEDRKGRLWVGTMTGLDRYDRKTGRFTHFGLEHGLPDLVIGHLLEDGAGRLWLATGKGIARYDEAANRFYSYDKTDGLSSNESWDFIKSPSTGAFLLATADGLTMFHPDSLRPNPTPPPVVFTRFTRYDVRENETVEEPGISGKTAVTLSPHEKIFTVEFAALSFRKTEKNRYAYLLEGFNKNWVPLGSKREVSFTHLDPGTYTLRVKASIGDPDSHRGWNETGASLKIIILPPWYRTWWAYLAYAALLAAAIYFVFKMLKNKWLLKMELEMEHREAERLKELDAAKTRLYTNITHEFRTPLTVISGMAEQIREHPAETLGAGVDMIKRNSQYLLRLVNQMLDLRKLEVGKMPVDMVNGDVLPFLRYLLESFHSLANSKNIQLHFETELQLLEMDFDADKLQKIVSNLLSNALKFTPVGGKVTLFAGLRNEERGMISHVGSTPITHPSFFVLTISDTGIGTPPEKLPFIFDHFYQVDDTHSRPGEGTGIGLALTKELVNLMGGTIEVESTPGAGSVFTVMLPLTQHAEKRQPAFEGEMHEAAVLPMATNGTDSTPVEPTSQRPTVLLIEDNTDVVSYLKTCLQENYNLRAAPNGRLGLAQALETIPDLILSDVMMPEMDGYELCKTLKNDVRTSHIPVILLTAKADVDSRLEGLDCGADAYLPKPFEPRELSLRIRKLLELRQKMQAHYIALATGQPMYPAGISPQTIETKEGAFVQKIRDIIEQHLDNTQFSTEELGKQTAMSRSQLHRKLTALTGLSPNHFIRHIRLKNAQRRLLETEETIAEIAYAMGFSDPGYFTRVFKQEFGMAPGEWRGRS
jgi:signal transduction histidine kinase/ligand-binding sensor domain-containing protein/DNA-binding response OmpR family regulator